MADKAWSGRPPQLEATMIVAALMRMSGLAVCCCYQDHTQIPHHWRHYRGANSAQEPGATMTPRLACLQVTFDEACHAYWANCCCIAVAHMALGL